MQNEMENSTIKKFFRNSNVLLTGGTGCLGKLLISKLLLSGEVSRIYLLVRKKKSKSLLQRMEEMFANPVFDHLKITLPHYRERITLIEGDCAAENLGLSKEDEEILHENVHVVIHTAAAMSMLGSLKTAIQINVRGTLDLVRLAKKMSNLKCFCHVSSIGVLLDEEVFDEKFYDTHLTYEDLLNLLKIDHILPIDEMNEKKICGSKQTMYILTKAVSEKIFAKEKLQVPTVIFRCSQVMCCWEEPLKGWTDNFYGTNGLITLSLFGIQQVFYGNFTEMGDNLPADYTVNACIAAIVFSYNEFKKTSDKKMNVSPLIFNYSSAKNPLSMKMIASYMKETYGEYPTFCPNKPLFLVWCLFFHYIPAALMDMCLYFVLGRNFGLLKIYQMADEIAYRFSFFIHSYCVISDNVDRSWKSIEEVDKKLFPFDVWNIEWENFLPCYVQGVRKYFLTGHKYRKYVPYVLWIKRLRRILAVVYFLFGLYCVQMVYRWILQTGS